MGTTNKNTTEVFTKTGGYNGGFCCPWEQINSPGSYVVNHTGALVRLPSDGLIPGRSPAITIVANDNFLVTKICDDPFVPLTKARMIAADLDLCVNF